jgi:hypothetical protein
MKRKGRAPWKALFQAILKESEFHYYFQTVGREMMG